MPVHKKFKIRPEDLEHCLSEVRKRDIPRWKYHRYKILLMLHEDRVYTEIQEKLGVSSHTIKTWKDRYAKEGLDGLKDRPRPGGRRVPAEIEAKVCAIVQGPPPEGLSHWTAKAIAEIVKIPERTIYAILARNKLKPHQQKTFMVSNDPQFEHKATKIIGLYIKPPQSAVVLCIDEKTQIQALDRKQPNLPLISGSCERFTYQYRRNGITNLYAAFNIKSGRVSGECSKTHNQDDFIRFLNRLNREYRHAKKIHVVLDNVSSHKTRRVQEWLKKHPKWEFHFTPTYSSWLNQVEIWFSIISRQCIRRGVFHSVKDLTEKIMTYIGEYNKNRKPFLWTYRNPAKRITAGI